MATQPAPVYAPAIQGGIFRGTVTGMGAGEINPATGLVDPNYVQPPAKVVAGVTQSSDGKYYAPNQETAQALAKAGVPVGDIMQPARGVPGKYLPYGSTSYSGPGAQTLSGVSDGIGQLALDARGLISGIVGGILPGGGTAPTANTATIDGDLQAARTLQAQFNNAYTNFQPNVAPTVQAAQLDAQRDAVAGQVAAVRQVVAPNVGTAQQVQAATVGQYLSAAGAAAQAGTATAQQIGAIERAQAERVAAIERVQGVNVQGAPAVSSGGPVIAERAAATTLDPSQQVEFRENQKTLLGYLTGAIDGTAPSVAKLQLDAATQRNAANQLGLASAASRGGNSALALRTAANNIGMLNQRAAADAALLRATEVATARGQYGEVANSGRVTDVSMAGQDASLKTGVSQTNAQLGTQANITGATLAQKASEATANNTISTNNLQAQLAQAAQTTNANNYLAQQTTNATLGTQVNLGNANNSLARDTTNATLGTQASVVNANNQTAASVATANNETQASVANANNSLAAQIAQAKLTQDASTSNAANATTLQTLQAQLLYNASHDNAGNELSAAQTNANLQTQASTTNATNATNLNTTQGQLTNAANLANAANQVTTTGQNITEQQNAAANTLSASGQTIQGDAATLDANTKLQAAQISADSQEKAALYGAAGSALSVLNPLKPSDRRLKKNVSRGDGDAQDLLDHLTAKSFDYKNPSHGRGGRETGVMAQDVERSRAGRTFVRDTAKGKELDPVAGFGSVLAMLSTMNDRMKKLEGRRAT